MVFGLPSQSAFAADGDAAVVSLALLHRAGLMAQYINQCSGKKERSIMGERRGYQIRAMVGPIEKNMF